MINLKNWLLKTGEYNNLIEFIQNKLKRSIVMIQIIKAKKISKSKKTQKITQENLDWWLALPVG